MDAGLSAAVVKVFVDLYADGLIYRGTRLVNWDPKAQSTLSDAEVENEELDTFLWHLRYRGGGRRRGPRDRDHPARDVSRRRGRCGAS